MPNVDWDFDFSFQERNPNYQPPAIESDSEWIKDLYKNILIRKLMNEILATNIGWKG